MPMAKAPARVAVNDEKRPTSAAASAGTMSSESSTIDMPTTGAMRIAARAARADPPPTVPVAPKSEAQPTAAAARAFPSTAAAAAEETAPQRAAHYAQSH